MVCISVDLFMQRWTIEVPRIFFDKLAGNWNNPGTVNLIGYLPLYWINSIDSFEWNCGVKLNFHIEIRLPE